MKTILLTNDDGFDAKGILELRKSLQKIAHVITIAPSSQKSACSHCITLTRPLNFIKIEEDFYKLNDATPSDCVYLGIEVLCKDKKPDLIVSGINHGANLGEDVSYSGTCAAAMEGTLQGYNSIAISQYYNLKKSKKIDLELACQVAVEVIQGIFTNGFPLKNREFLNLNIPAVSKDEYKGIKVTPLSHRIYNTKAKPVENQDAHYWLGDNDLAIKNLSHEDCDLNHLHNGFASLTPIKMDFTAHESLEKLKQWIR